MTLLSDLPAEHPLRNRPVQCMWVRYVFPLQPNADDNDEVRAAKRARREAGEMQRTAWKQITGWPISKFTYNQLKPIWTANAEWTEDPKPTNLQ